MTKVVDEIEHAEGPADPPEYVVDADDAVRAGGPAVVHDRDVTLEPDPAAVLGQKPVVLGRHLALEQHWK